MWWLIQFIIVVIIIETFWIVFLKHGERRNVMLTWVSIAITLFGILIAVADGYLSQYDYDRTKIREHVTYKKKGIAFSTLVGGQSDTPPQYIFVMDVSKSTMSHRVPKTVSIEYQINDINSCGRLTTERETFKEDSKGNLLFSELLRIRLLHLLLQLEEKEYDNIEYSIVYFAGICSHKRSQKGKLLCERIDDSYVEIMKTEFDGNNTDFKALFDFIHKEYIKDVELEDPYKKKDVIIVFLTDYIHDVKNENTNEVEKALIESIEKMENKSVNLSLFMLYDNDNLVEIRPKKNTIDISKLIQEHLPKARFAKLDVKNSEDIFYPLILSTPFPFYYSNSVFERSLKTDILFDHEQNLCFYMGDTYTNTNKLEFRLHPCGSKKTIRISRNKNQVPIKEGKSSIELFGYIPAPYTCPDIIVEDVSKGVQYIMPVVFYKDCPKTVRWLSCIITLIVVYLFMLLIGKKQKEEQNCNYNEQEMKQKQDQENVTTAYLT